MGLFDFLKKDNDEDKNSEDKKRNLDNVNLTSERSDIKQKVANDFREKLGFTELEIKEILDVVALAEAEMDEVKRSVINVNYNNPNAEYDTEYAASQIQEIAVQMSENIKKKAAEIMKRRKDMEDIKKAGY